MYLVTNREIDIKNEPEMKFGISPNPKGCDALRLGKAVRTGRKWGIELIDEPKNLTTASPILGRPSFQLFRELQNRLTEENRNCVFFVHGYNTNIEEAVAAAARVEELYGVEVILFSWPSQGGGEGRDTVGKDILGTVNYKRDKRIAAESTGALDRCFEILNTYMYAVTLPDEQLKSMSMLDCVREYHPSDYKCTQRLTLVCHSMGNYLLKNLLRSSIYQRETLMFDNVVLCAADVNSDGHADFVDRIEHRRRPYITINENDYALGWSRRKLGAAQRARLGHYTRNLSSRNAVYLDFTDAESVGKSHSYFSDKGPTGNENVRNVFRDIFNGQRGERNLPDFDPQRTVYSIA